MQPEQANIRLIVPTLTDTDGGTPSKIRILSVDGGTLWDSGGGTITLGSAGTKLTLTAGKLDLRFRPDSNRETNATFSYVVVDVQDETLNSAASTATISITAVNDTPLLQTVSGDTGYGLAATYYINAWDLTGSTYLRIDPTVNFGNDFGVPGLNDENFSVRWTGQVKAPVSGSFTFSTLSDDGVRLWVNDALIINNWTLHGSTVDTSSPVTLTGSQLYDIRMEFYERGGGEVAELRWAYPGQATQIIPQAYLFPATTRPTLNYVSGTASAVIDDGLTITDVDDTTLAGATVSISAGYNAGEDSLLFTNQNGISGAYAAGTLELTGTATVSQYQAALRTVRYANSNANPDTTTRTLTFTVDDGQDGSNSTFRNIDFTAVNTPPVITEGTGTGVTMDEDGSPTAFALTLHATDIDFQVLSWSVSSQAAHGTASASGDGESKAITYIPTADYHGSDSFIVQVSDGSGGTDTITVTVTIRDRTPPVITPVSAVASTSTSVTITWTTDENASTRVNFGPTSAYGTFTTETDTSPRVSSHTKTITGLLPCTTYHYTRISADAAANSTTQAGGTFTTPGCAGEAAVMAGTGTDVIPNSTGSAADITLSGATLQVPPGYVSGNPTCASGAVFQLKSLETAAVKEALGAPTGRDDIVDAMNLSAYCPDATPVTEFDEPLTVIFAYTDGDIENLDEESLSAYRFGSGSTAWEELSCAKLPASNRLTCTTTRFSSFALFGSPIVSAGAAQVVRAGGCRGSNCAAPPTVDVAARRTVTGDASHGAAPTACLAASLPHLDGKLQLPVTDLTVTYDDVPTDAWFACAVREMIDRSIFSGYKDTRGSPTGRYGPEDPITFGQLAKVALLLRGDKEDETSGPRWADGYLAGAKAAGLSVFAGRVDAAAHAPRGMVVRTVLEALNLPLTGGDLPYSDVDPDSPDAAAIATATALGIVSGDDGKDTFRPDAPINRAEVAKIIALALAEPR
ncbi:MAG: S-layer homology domain-containing protein [Candidatus Peribacteraceae bacterium]|nr:S-layer homology domain-containing protein [Candidatus Peribacteraceae bacterium]